MNYQLICGAEIHVELKTKSKMFCGCKNDPFHAPKPNLYTCPTCLGLPGGLPVPNEQAIEDTILLGLALHCEIASHSYFERKHYFYPDLPKGYQISQRDEPLCLGGYIDTSFGRVRLNHIHLEEDAAKMQHATVAGKNVSLIDYNRGGVPLVEIVSEPEIHSTEQAKEFLKKIREIVRATGISAADMEKGSMRLEANISLSSDGKLPPYKVEVKNINSFRFFTLAMDYEAKRQAELLDKGETPIQETRGFRETGSATVSQRGKVGAADYRYMPDPDIPPLVISKELVEKIRARLPKLPEELVKELSALGVSAAAAEIIVKSPEMLTFITRVNTVNKDYVKQAANDIVNKKIDHNTLSPEEYIESKKSSASAAISDEAALKPIIEKVLSDHANVVADFKAGKAAAMGFLVGQVMKATQGKADPKTANKLLQNLLH